MAAKYKSCKRFNSDKIQLIDDVKKAMHQFNFKINKIDENLGYIIAETKFSLWSWKEDIQVRVYEDGLIKIKSECSLSTQALDWGKNKQNVRRIFKYLKDNQMPEMKFVK